MSDDSDNLTEVTDSGERSLVDSAWAQFDALAERRKPSPTDDRRGLAIPGYRVLRELHRGGQGVVYQAMQEATLRKVAIKVLKGGALADPTELTRFDREVDILSRLKHRNIVAIHDRGLTSGGHAYYVMDYIPGRSLDAYVAGAALSTRDILKLFHAICEAMNVAHLRGVIHRDLKPSNIRIDEENEPHILDFGLAKLAHDTGTSAAAVMTITGQFVGSLPWSSPEQVAGQSDLVDVRTDVYSLGVILYQILTRSFPYPVSGQISDVVQSIAHTNPARPTSLSSEIERDTEIILLKCLEKEPERRYQSAGELARDIHRYLNGEPIEARPATSLYQLRQFTRRNRALVTSVITVVFVLAAATIVSVAFAFREAAARTQTRAVADFQAQMLADIDPQTMGVKLRDDMFRKVRGEQERLGRNVEEVDAHVAELQKHIAGIDITGLALNALNENVFQRALAAIDRQFGDQPLIKAQLLQTLASTLQGLGLLDAAVGPQDEALRVRRGELGNEHPDSLVSVAEMGRLRLAQGKLAEAEPCLHDALEGLRRVRGDQHPDTLRTLTTRGQLFHAQGKLVEAEACLREAMENLRRVLGSHHPDTFLAISNLGMLLQEQNRLSEAEPFLAEALESRRSVLGDENLQTLVSMNNMGVLLHAQGRLEEAEAYFRESLQKHRRVLGNEHPNTLAAIGNMGFVLRAQGRLAEVEPFYLEALEKRRRLLGNEHPDTLTSIHNMGFLLLVQGKPVEAEPYCREAMDTWRRLLGDQHPDTLIAINNMGLVLLLQGRLSEAEPYCREAVVTRRRVRGEEHSDTLISMTNLGNLLRLRDQPLEAIELLAPAESSARKAFTGGNVIRLGRFLTALGRSRVASSEYFAAEANLTEAYAILNEATGATVLDRAEVGIGLVELYEAWHTTAPNEGFDAKATEWRTKLTER